MSNYRAPKSQLIELIIPPTITSPNQSVYFQNQPQLQSIMGDKAVFIEGIETYSDVHMSASPITAGNAVASITDIINGVLTLNVAGTLDFQMIPLADLVRIWVEGITAPDEGAANVHVKDIFLFEDLYKVDWTKSYVTMMNAPTDAPFSYLFNVYYRWGQNVNI